MPTSGSYDWTLTRDDIIKQAFEDIGAIAENDTVTPEKLFMASRRLNGIVKQLQQKHIHLWTIEQAQHTFTASSGVTNGGDTYRCILNHTSSATDEPGVGANWSTFWVLDGSASSPSVWALATAYTSAGELTFANDTIGIDYAFLRESGFDYPIEIVARENYSNILTKHDQGKPYKLVFDRQLPAKGYLYYHPDRTDYVLHYSRVRKLEDFDSGNDNFDGPESWIPLLIKMLARNMCGIYQIPLQERMVLDGEITVLLKEAKQYDSEDQDNDFVQGSFSDRREGWRNQRRRY